MEEKTLSQQIEEKSKEISTDNLSMSIGEIINMYKDGDLDIHPEFQRFYRWNDSQKSKFIESILLNIPIPAIFVSQKPDGIWDVVDGLQRISTILEFVGVYKDVNGQFRTPLKLQGTKMLPKLQNVCYVKDNTDDSDDSVEMDTDIKRYFKRAKLLFIVIKKESDITGKYEIFQRLNTGGSSLSDQEVRNCMMVMENPSRFEIIENTSKHESFQNTLRLSDSELDQRFDLELMTRFLCLRTVDLKGMTKFSNFGEYLNDRILEIFKLDDDAFEEEINIFKETFNVINREMGDEAFCKYDSSKDKFTGRFYSGAFEIIALGLGRNNNFKEYSKIKEFSKQIWKDIQSGFNNGWKGNNAFGRLNKTLAIGDRLFGNEQDK